MRDFERNSREFKEIKVNIILNKMEHTNIETMTGKNRKNQGIYRQRMVGLSI